VSDESREISPFEFLSDDADGDFRAIDREVLDPKGESAQESVQSSESTPTLESEEIVIASTETIPPKGSEPSTVNSSPRTSHGKSEQPVAASLPTPPQIPTPGSQSEGKQTSPTKRS
jgi:hypothetical protein